MPKISKNRKKKKSSKTKKANKKKPIQKKTSMELINNENNPSSATNDLKFETPTQTIPSPINPQHLQINQNNDIKIKDPFNSNMTSPNKSLIDLQLIAKPQSTSSSENSKSEVNYFDFMKHENSPANSDEEGELDHLKKEMTSLSKGVN